MQGDNKMHDDMMMQKEKQTKLIGGNPRDVTDDTTNKGSRPRDPPQDNRKKGINYRVFTLHVDLLDTTNKRSLLTSTMMLFCQNSSKIEPIRLKVKIVQPT